MFGNLKEKIISVGRNVKLFSGDVKPPAPSSYTDVNLNAGAAILNHFQEQWEKIHEVNEENAQNAETLAKLIDEMHKKMNSDHRNILDITYLLSNGSSSLTESVVNCVTQVEALHQSFELVEKDLLQLENLIENLELQEKELEHRFQLALYKEKKLANLEALRLQLAERHTQSVSEYECRQKQLLQERQQVFAEAFQSDLQQYKQQGTIPSKYIKFI